MRGDWEVGEDKLSLLMKAEQGEVVPQFHGLNGVLLLSRVDTKQINWYERCGEAIPRHQSTP